MNEKPEEFKIGLVMAGAVSAGAYTAGVVDFLLEALEAWKNAKNDVAAGAKVPNHKVSITALSGASAGAMTAAMLVRSFVTGITPVQNVDAPPDTPSENPIDQREEFKNPLYAAWVQSIDIRHLLGGGDLKQNKDKVVSLLDSSILPIISDNVLNVTNHKSPKPNYLSDPLHIFFTTTNLRGVPYGFKLTGQSTYMHMMTAHADYRQFSLSWSNGSSPGKLTPGTLTPAGLLGRDDEWKAMMNTALASGAFPVGLAPRLLRRKASDYDTREWPVPEDQSPQNKMRNIPPTWPKGICNAGPNPPWADPSYVYEYWNVDGGVMDNEPLELVRRTLSGGGRNKRDGAEADRAVIMIDPFPNTSDVNNDYKQDAGLVKTAMRLFGALIEQARFKPDELILAADPNVYSRFVISPIYNSSTNPAIASAVLGGFGGFLAESFRRHDFQLGRRNCQQFLREHFTLPHSNKLFASWSDDITLTNKYAVPNSSGAYELPIIPLIGIPANGIPLPNRPRADQVDLDDLRKRVQERIDLIVPRMIDTVSSTGLRWLLRVLWFGAKLLGQRGKIVGMIIDKIKAEVAVLG